MALEYVVAGRRSLPGMFRLARWSWVFSIDCSDDEAEEDDDAPSWGEGSFELDEIRRNDGADFYTFVKRHAGFEPRSVITIRKAGWELSRAAAEVVAAALDGVMFVDGLVEEHGVEQPPATPPAQSIEELQARIEAAARAPAAFFERWEQAARRAQEEHDRLHPEDAELRSRENDWSDV